jgi:hypothetical protein
VDPLLRIFTELATLTNEIKHLRSDLVESRAEVSRLGTRLSDLEHGWLRVSGAAAGAGVVVGVVLRFFGV